MYNDSLNHLMRGDARPPSEHLIQFKAAHNKGRNFMFRKLLSALLVGLLIQLACIQPASAAPIKEDKDARFAEKVKAGIAKLGTGPQSLVEVKLRDKRKLSGYIGEAADDYFVVVDAGGSSTHIPYPQVKSVKGNNLSTGAKIAIGVALVGGIFLIAILLLKQTK